MLKELENHNWEVEGDRGRALMPWIRDAFNSLAIDGVVEASRDQIVRKIRKIRPSKNIFDLSEGKIVDLALDMMGEEDEVEFRIVEPSKKTLLKSMPQVLYRKINPKQQTSAE